MRGLFVNSPKAQCSIYEVGAMYYNIFKLTTKHTLDYEEYNGVDYIPTSGYDFYIMVYHDYIWRGYNIEKLRPYADKIIGIIFEMWPNQPFVKYPDWFSKYIVADPTMNYKDKRVCAFPRPIPDFNESIPLYAIDRVVVGTFGLFPSEKRIMDILNIISLECKRATVRINIPYASVTTDKHNEEMIEVIRRGCNQKTKADIDIIMTHVYLTMNNLIQWCAQNTCNFFIYNRPASTGVAACTDQAIASGRPILVNNDISFRHIHKYIKPYPEISLKEIVINGGESVKRMKEDWNSAHTLNAFEEIVS